MRMYFGSLNSSWLSRISLLGPATSGWEVHMDRFRYWVAVTIALILIAYGPFLVSYLPARLLSPGFSFY